MKATYRNSVRSKELIRSALITLLEKKKKTRHNKHNSFRHC